MKIANKLLMTVADAVQVRVGDERCRCWEICCGCWAIGGTDRKERGYIETPYKIELWRSRRGGEGGFARAQRVRRVCVGSQRYASLIRVLHEGHLLTASWHIGQIQH